jgi:hypothetical protein
MTRPEKARRATGEGMAKHQPGHWETTPNRWGSNPGVPREGQWQENLSEDS